jgi:hypothetical protein
MGKYNKRKKALVWLLFASVCIGSFSGCEKEQTQVETEQSTEAVKELKLEAAPEGGYYLLSSGEKDGNEEIDAFTYDEESYVVITQVQDDYRWQMCRKNIYTGEVTEFVDCQSDNQFCLEVELAQNGAVYCFSMNGQVLIYDANWSLKETREVGHDIVNMYFDKDSDMLYFIEDNTLWCYDFSLDQATALSDIDSTYGSCTITDMLVAQKILLLNGYSDDGAEEAVYYLIEDNSFVTGGDSRYNRVVRGEKIYFWKYDSNVLKWVDVNNNRSVISFALDTKEEADEVMWDDDGAYLFAHSYPTDESGENDFSIYDLETQKKIAAWTMSDTQYSYTLVEAQSSTSTYMVVNRSTDTGVELLLWDYNAYMESYETEEAFSNYYAVGGDAATNDQREKSIEKTYGISVYTRDEAVRFFPDFAVTPTSDESDLDTGLKALEEVAALFGKDFFEEFQYSLYDGEDGQIEGVDVYLCGTLIQGSDTGTSSPAAFSLQYDNRQILVIDVTQDRDSIRNSICHELWHAIETKIDSMVADGEVDGIDLDKWESLNPDGFDYFYSYVTDDGEDIMTYTSPENTPDEEDEDDVYFVDGYCKTYADEDRARLFENTIWVQSESDLPDVIKNYPHIKKKAAYLYKVLQACFPDVEAFQNPVGLK